MANTTKDQNHLEGTRTLRQGEKVKKIKGQDFHKITTPYSTDKNLKSKKNKAMLHSTLTAIYMVVPPRLTRKRTDEPFCTDASRLW